eukprot:scaffold108711_cov59-Phaeocystis_antarctica.AAC.2
MPPLVGCRSFSAASSSRHLPHRPAASSALTSAPVALTSCVQGYTMSTQAPGVGATEGARLRERQYAIRRKACAISCSRALCTNMELSPRVRGRPLSASVQGLPSIPSSHPRLLNLLKGHVDVRQSTRVLETLARKLVQSIHLRLRSHVTPDPVRHCLDKLHVHDGQQMLWGWRFVIWGRHRGKNGVLHLELDVREWVHCQGAPALGRVSTLKKQRTLLNALCMSAPGSPLWCRLLQRTPAGHSFFYSTKFDPSNAKYGPRERAALKPLKP